MGRIRALTLVEGISWPVDSTLVSCPRSLLYDIACVAFIAAVAAHRRITLTEIL